MADYDDIADLTIELGESRNEFNDLAGAYFGLRQELSSRWWTRSGAGTPHELASQMREALAGERADLADYWYFPSGKHNPYLDLLYAELPAHGLRVRELPSFDELPLLVSNCTLHLHWTQSLRPNGSDAEQNQQALDRAKRLLRAFKAGEGNKLIWSVHEPLPHGSLWPAQDADFHQFLCDTADVIHILHPSTVQVCAEYFHIDEAKTVLVEHPLYTGVYSSYRSRSSARALLGIAPDELCVVFFGAIRAYKGIDRLLEATGTAATQRRLRLLIAGMPVGEVQDLQARVDAHPEASAAAMLVPDSEIQTLLGAADVLVIPYQRFLNSAVVMLALSFGVPVIATENPVTTTARSSGLVSTYTTLDELVAELAGAVVDPHVELDAQFALDHAATKISDDFARALRSQLWSD